MHRFIFAFLLVVGLGVVSGGSPVLAVAPSPSFDTSCVVGGDTTVSWKHVRVSEIHIDYFNSGNVLVAQTIAFPKRPKYSEPTPAAVDAGGHIEVQLQFANGGGAQLSPRSCT